MTVDLEIPRILPVEHLSVSSIGTYIKCPERWKRRYVDREYEPTSGLALLGSAVHAAEGAAYQEQIDNGERLATAEVLDLFSDEFDERAGRDEVDWGANDPGEIKDSGVGAVKAYDATIAPSVRPVSVERPYMVDLEGVDWTFEGFLDLEQDDGAVADLKVKGRKLSQADADIDLQPTANLFARRAEGNPAPGFAFHTMVRTKTPYAEIVPTQRTDAQLDAFTTRLYGIAAEINWRLEHDVWGGAVPGSWWCSSKFCGFHASCPMGGLR